MTLPKFLPKNRIQSTLRLVDCGRFPSNRSKHGQHSVVAQERNELKPYGRLHAGLRRAATPSFRLPCPSDLCCTSVFANATANVVGNDRMIGRGEAAKMDGDVSAFHRSQYRFPWNVLPAMKPEIKMLLIRMSRTRNRRSLTDRRRRTKYQVKIYLYKQ